MGTRTLAQVTPTAGEIALNAYIYGYGGHSLVTPHVALKQLWWTDDRIDAKVTRPFVVSKLRGEEREFLDRAMAFGDGLTDDTYMDWILDRAKRLFLILSEIGVPDQIFGCIDDSWDDDDLPVALESVSSLELSYDGDKALDRKFYDRQFVYLLRELKKGAHLDYGPKEHIPMDYVNTLPPAVSLQSWDRVHFPGRSDDIFVRRKYPLLDKDTGNSHHDTFLRDVRRAQTLRHRHIAPTWASYTSEDSGYVLSDFVAEHTLRTFIDHRTPMQFVRLPVEERPVMICEWMHCLASALTFLHRRGTAHTAIRPSNILVDNHNHIAFADIGSIKTFQQGKKANKTEAYDYAAPEAQICREPLSILASSTSPPMSSMSVFNKLRKMSSSTSGSSTNSSSGGSSTRSNSFCTPATASPATTSAPFSPSVRSNSLTSLANTVSPFSLSKSARNFSRHIASPSPSFSGWSSFSNAPPSPTSTVRVLPRATAIDPDTLRDLPTARPEMSDIFSLGCVYLDILTFMLKGKLGDFVKIRSSLHSIPSSPRNSRKTRPHLDSSFHANLDNLDIWMTMLKDDSGRRSDPIFQAVPDLLRLCKKMLSQNAQVRPSAREVADKMSDILTDICGVRRLCCASEMATIEESTRPGAHGRDCTAPSTLRKQESMEEACAAPDVPRTREARMSGRVTEPASGVKLPKGSWKSLFARVRTS